MGKKEPKQPDAAAVAAAQGEQNRQATAESARLNAMDLYGPLGTTTYDFGNRGNLTNVPIAQHTTLTPTGQQIFDNQQQVALDLSGRAITALNNAPQTPFSLAGMPYDPRGYDTNAMSMWARGSNLPYDPRNIDVREYDQQAADAVWNQGMRRMQPAFDQQQRRLESNLHNRGLPLTGTAWGTATAALNQSQNDAMLNLADQSYLTGHNVAGDWLSRGQGLRSTAYNEDLTDHKQGYSDYGNKLQIEQNLRNQAINEAERTRLAAFNDASMYLQGSPAQQLPNAPNTPTYQIQAPDLMGATYKSAEMANQAAQQRNSSFGNALGNAAMIGARMWMMSSAVLKEHIGDADAFLNRARQLPIRTWQYTPEAAAVGDADTEMHIGPMAEDWSRLFGGPETRIHLGDAIFVLWRAVQELAAKVDSVSVKHA